MSAWPNMSTRHFQAWSYNIKHYVSGFSQHHSWRVERLAFCRSPSIITLVYRPVGRQSKEKGKEKIAAGPLRPDKLQFDILPSGRQFWCISAAPPATTTPSSQRQSPSSICPSQAAGLPPPLPTSQVKHKMYSPFSLALFWMIFFFLSFHSSFTD